MKCITHPSAVIQWQEVTETNTHPITEEPVRINREIPYCPVCFEEFTKTGKYEPKLETTELEHLESKIDVFIHNQIQGG